MRQFLLPTKVCAAFISIHALTRSATPLTVNKKLPFPLFQSTHSQGVRLFQVSKTRGINYISIHALTRSATIVQLLSQPLLSYFNPRTHKECDLSAVYFVLCSEDFNPRTHKECDVSLDLQSWTYKISIHALTRSATSV